MNGTLPIAFLLLLTQASSVALAKPKTVFEALEGFKGKWNIQAGGKSLPIEMTYDEGSKDSIVTEQFGKELSVFYRDGKNILMTHFCNAGNQPRLKLNDSNEPGKFEFVTFDVTNLKNADDPHVRRIIYRVRNEKQIELELVWKKGKSEESEKYVLSKK